MRHHGWVAGGMSGGANWGSMADRVARRAARAADAPCSPPGTLKHCWVNDEHGRLPALLLEWRRTAGGYQGRVARAVLESGGDWIVVEEWLPAQLLEPTASR